MERNYIAGNECVNFDALVESIIKRSCIIDYGIVQDVPAEGVVTVSVAVSETTQSMLIMTCVLANIASNSITITAKPNKGDRVLVVYPRIYDENMFTVPSSDTEKTKIIVNRNAKGYNLLSGIAILLNQYKKASHNNVIKFDDGTVDLKLAYKDNKNLLNLTINADGEVTFNSNDKVSITVNKDGEAELKSNNIDIKVDKDGALTINNKAEITVDKNGNVTVNAKAGKVSIKNTQANLYTILNGMLNILNTSLATAGSETAQTVVPGQFATQATQLSGLMQ